MFAFSDYTSSVGTGFFIDDKGTIATNFHVIDNCSSANITTSDGESYVVTRVLGYDANLDIAILATSKDKSVPIEISFSVTTGESVYVLGSSMGLTGTFSEGIVSSAERTLNGNCYIQISAPISQGNSGGPVANSMGQVIGIACAAIEEGQNLNLAIPVSYIGKISTNTPISLQALYDSTCEYDYLWQNVVAYGSSCAIRTITIDDSFMAEYILAKWRRAEASEATMIDIMDEYGADQGGGQLYIIDPGVFVEEIDDWCFAEERKPGDCAIIKNDYGYSICYYSFVNE